MTISITTQKNSTVLACFSLIVGGPFEALDELAREIASRLPGCQIVLLQYPAGFMLQVIGPDGALADAEALVEARIDAGMQIEIVNDEPMPTRLYAAEPACNDPACPCRQA